MKLINGIVEAIIIDVVLAVITFLPAFFVMLYEGAVADNFHWHTYGYMTWYFALLLLAEVGSIATRGISISLGYLNKAVRGLD